MRYGDCGNERPTFTMFGLALLYVGEEDGLYSPLLLRIGFIISGVANEAIIAGEREVLVDVNYW
jgi:hypothetical protein